MDTPRPWHSVSSQSATSTSWNADDGRAPRNPRAAPFFKSEQHIRTIFVLDKLFYTK